MERVNKHNRFCKIFCDFQPRLRILILSYLQNKSKKIVLSLKKLENNENALR